MTKRYFTHATLWRKGCWFRIFGFGLSFAIDERPLFSERCGHRRVYRVGRLAIQVLKP